TPGTALGYAEASALFSSFPATFVGQSIDNSAVLVRYTLAGDGNSDGTVNIGDFSVLASRFNQPGNWSQGDYNYSGQVDIADFSLLASRFNTSVASLPRP